MTTDRTGQVPFQQRAAASPSAEGTAELGRRCHPTCIVCGPEGLGLRFRPEPDDSVAAEFDCGVRFQGYPDRLHGGVVAMLLDAAMTHCLFARKVAALTARLSIRYSRGVALGVRALVRARIVDSEGPLYYLESEVLQDGHVCAAARATFWDSACGEPADGTMSESAETSRRRSPSAAIQQQKRRSL